MKLFFSVILTVGIGFLAGCQEQSNNIHLAVAETPSSPRYVSTNGLFENNWAIQPQTKFWMKIMRLAPDSCIINIASSRKVIETRSLKSWRLMSSTQRVGYLDSIRRKYNVDSTDKINITTGKSDFYRFEKVYPLLPRGIQAFEANQVDPWYAQAILLIESPVGLQRSSAGAYGPFQLMPGVARRFGLTVNKSTDERKNFERSAYAASELLKEICIPSAKQILSDNGYSFNESDWWFRLFVLHVYHAGAINVRKVVETIGTLSNGNELIRKMWHTKAGQFGNNSQNYTQLALAALSILHLEVQSYGKETTTAKADGKM